MLLKYMHLFLCKMVQTITLGSFINMVNDICYVYVAIMDDNLTSCLAKKTSIVNREYFCVARIVHAHVIV